MKFKNGFFICLGCICLGLGTIGIFLPILPTTPFYMLTLFCFARGSKPLYRWFITTDLYKKHLESFVLNRGMLRKTKISIMITVSILMCIGFVMMAQKGIWLPCALLIIVWILHIFYFTLKVKTIPEKKGVKGAENV